jgi:hypothetical protein
MIQDISDISTLSGTFVIDFWISSIWHDTRLKFSHLDPCRKNLSLDHDMEPKLWFVRRTSFIIKHQWLYPIISFILTYLMRFLKNIINQIIYETFQW